AESGQASREQASARVIPQPTKPFRLQIAKRSMLKASRSTPGEPASRCLACSWVATASAREAYHKKFVQVVPQGLMYTAAPKKTPQAKVATIWEIMAQYTAPLPRNSVCEGFRLLSVIVSAFRRAAATD